MDRETAKDIVKGYLADYLTSHGHNIRKPFICLNPEHPDRSPSMSYDPRRNKVQCFSCGADYDIIDLIGFEYGIRDERAKFEKAYSLYGLDPENQNKPKSEHNTHTHIHTYGEGAINFEATGTKNRVY